MSQAPHVRNVLQTYSQQMASGIRLHKAVRKAACDGAHSERAVAGEIRPVADAATQGASPDPRQETIERVAREIIDNLLVTGSPNPIVKEIADELERQFDSRFLFEYGFLECDLQVSRQTKNGTEQLTGDEAANVLDALWRITLSTVDRTML